MLCAVSDHPASHSRRRRPWAAPLSARSATEPHRVSTPLELLFDLVFVVAIAQAAAGLHDALSEGHAAAGVRMYAMVFFGIWWAWLNFTWFASAYDNDDVMYRLLVFLQLTGALIFAAGIPRFQNGDLAVGVAGYVVMRLALVSLWLRAAKGDPPRRAAAQRYALGVLLVQTAWVGLVFTPARLHLLGFAALVVCEVLVPAWAEHATPTTWHPHHIAERYGLFTIITLGESILAASIALKSAFEAGATALSLLPIIAGGLLIVYSLWWLYFDRAAHEVLDSAPAAFLWGYGHYFVFGAAAAVGAGLGVSIDHAMHRLHITDSLAGAAVAVPVAVYLLCLWFLHARKEPGVSIATPLVAIAVLLSTLMGQAVLCTGVLVAGLVGFKAVEATSADRSS